MDIVNYEQHHIEGGINRLFMIDELVGCSRSWQLTQGVTEKYEKVDYSQSD